MIRNLISFILGLAVYASAVAQQPWPVTNIGGRECYVYDVKKGENIYDVSKATGLTITEIKRFNPGAVDGLRQGMRLYFPTTMFKRSSATATGATASSSSQPHSQSMKPQVTTYTVGRNESLYGISRKLGVTMDDIISLNPSAEFGVKEGDLLVLTESARKEVEYEKPEIDYSLAPSEDRITRENVTIAPIPGYDADTQLVDRFASSDTVKVAVMLPFMLKNGSESKTSQLFVEFYKGLMLAVDSLQHQPGNHIMLYAYDTEGSADVVNSLMSSPEMTDADIIIGPDNEIQLQIIADRMAPNTYLYNVFNVRSTLSSTHSRVIQSNIPHGPMLHKAVDAFVEMYGSYCPVFVSRIDGAADKDAFTSLLMERLDRDSISFKSVTFKNLLSHTDLDTLSMDRNYVFVPVSGARAEFAKISEAIRRFGESRPDHSTAIFGYPDWIVFRGEYFTRLGQLGATIYTRFYASTAMEATREVMERYHQRYGREMLDAAPIQGSLGFDTGMYLLAAMKEYGTEWKSNLRPYTGLQSVYDYESAGNSGSMNNDALLIVTFAPDASNIVKTVIE